MRLLCADRLVERVMEAGTLQCDGSFCEDNRIIDVRYAPVRTVHTSRVNELEWRSRVSLGCARPCALQPIRRLRRSAPLSANEDRRA
jgi:hypothetical protein